MANWNGAVASREEVRELKRKAALRVAARIFNEKGYHATSLDEIAEEIGVTKTALYYYFKNKEALFLEVVQAENERVTQILEATLKESGPVRQRLCSGVAAYFDHLRAHPEGLAILLRAEEDHDEGQPKIDFRGMPEAHLAMTTGILQLGVPSGELRPDLDLQEAALLIVAMVELRCRLFLFEGRPLPDPEVLADLFMRGAAGQSHAPDSVHRTRHDKSETGGNAPVKPGAIRSE